jgi:hypothetical protein
MYNNVEITEHLSLCEALDRVLHKGAVIMGEATISVANVDLIYLGLKIVICSVDNLENERHSLETKVNLNLGTDGRLQVTPHAE